MLSYSFGAVHVLAKESMLSVSQLAWRNAVDILRVQPDGPYLLGGYSFGGSVIMETAMLLEQWGHDVAAVFLFDAAHGDAYAPADPDCTELTGSDIREFTENLLGTADRVALGWGPPDMHPKYSETWQKMTPMVRRAVNYSIGSHTRVHYYKFTNPHTHKPPHNTGMLLLLPSVVQGHHALG